jgi:hypothetical protein
MSEVLPTRPMHTMPGGGDRRNAGPRCHKRFCRFGTRRRFARRAEVRGEATGLDRVYIHATMMEATAVIRAETIGTTALANVLSVIARPSLHVTRDLREDEGSRCCKGKAEAGSSTYVRLMQPNRSDRLSAF